MAEEGDHEPVTENREESEEKIEYPLIVQYCGGKNFFWHVAYNSNVFKTKILLLFFVLLICH